MTKHKINILNEAKWASFIVPALLLYIIFMIIPCISTFYYSFTNWNGITSKFIGLDNFKNLLHDEMIRTAFGNSAMYAICITILQNFLGLLLAIFMVKKLCAVNALRTLFFMPYIFSALLLGYVWGFILEPNIGVINNALGTMHLSFLEQNWLGDPFWGRIMIITITIWQCMGYSMVIYVAGLQSISPELYEAAEIDGAGAISRFKNIDFPLIAPAFTINIILSLIGTLKLFDQIYALTNGGPGYSTNSMDSTLKLAIEGKEDK